MHRTSAPPLAWDDVRLFLALSRARTVGAAAKALGVDGSTVSRRLAALERSVGAVLFDRGRNGLTPTEAVEVLLPVAEEIEHAMHRFGGATQELDRNVEGVVRITCPADVAEVVVVPQLRELRKKHPKIRVELIPSEAMLDLTRREADVAIRTIRPTSGDLVVTKVTSARWLAAASPKLARELGALRAWTDAPWVGWGEGLHMAPPARWLARHAPEVDPIVRTDSLVLQIAAITGGVGVGLLPQPSVAHYRLVEVQTSRALRDDVAAWPTSELFLATHRALQNVPRVRLVWDVLARAMRDGGRKVAAPTPSRG